MATASADETCPIFDVESQREDAKFEHGNYIAPVMDLLLERESRRPHVFVTLYLVTSLVLVKSEPKTISVTLC